MWTNQSSHEQLLYGNDSALSSNVQMKRMITFETMETVLHEACKDSVYQSSAFALIEEAQEVACAPGSQNSTYA